MEMLLALAEKKKAKDAWMEIKTMSQGVERHKAAKVQTLKSEFESLNMKDTDLLDDFSMKLNGLVINIRAPGEDMKEAYVVKKLLCAVGSVKAHEERLTGQVKSYGGQLMLTEEDWLKKESESGKLLLTNEEWKRRMNKGGTDARYHTGRDKSQIKCYNCNINGHYTVDCHKPRLTSEAKQEAKQEAHLSQKEDDKPALLLAKNDKKDETVMLNKGGAISKLKEGASETGVGSNVWYFNSGASNHMIGDKSKFKELNLMITVGVKFGDGSTVQIKENGTVVFKCKNGEECTLEEVYYISILCSNLISLGKMSEKENMVVLNGNYLWVYEQSGTLLMKVKRSQNRLYKLLVENFKPMCLLSKIEEDTRLWHKHLGHVNFKSLNQMYSDQG